MKTKPIIFSSPMINALREGRKTQTRRVLNFRPSENWKPYSYGEVHRIEDGEPNPDKIIGWGYSNENGDEAYACPYGKIGDFFYVKEDYFLQKNYNPLPPSKCKGSLVMYAAGNGANVYGKKRVARFMPRWASRLTLEITGVKVERLQDISEEDAIKEGVEYWLSSLPRDFKKLRGILSDRYNSIQYRYLWESINGKDSWEANPWVWVLDFIVHSKNIDEVINAKHV